MEVASSVSVLRGHFWLLSAPCEQDKWHDLRGCKSCKRMRRTGIPLEERMEESGRGKPVHIDGTVSLVHLLDPIIRGYPGEVHQWQNRRTTPQSKQNKWRIENTTVIGSDACGLAAAAVSYGCSPIRPLYAHTTDGIDSDPGPRQSILKWERGDTATPE